MTQWTARISLVGCRRVNQLHAEVRERKKEREREGERERETEKKRGIKRVRKKVSRETDAHSQRQLPDGNKAQVRDALRAVVLFLVLLRDTWQHAPDVLQTHEQNRATKAQGQCRVHLPRAAVHGSPRSAGQCHG